MPDDPRQKILDAVRARLEAARAANPAARSVTVDLAVGEVPFSLLMTEIVRQRPAPVVVEGEAARAVDPMDDEPMDDPPSETEFPDVRLRGVASSTSVDWYGTEMSAACLEGMAVQFRAGVDLLPRHHGFLSSVEWDEVLGRTDTATLLSGPVANAAAPDEQGFRLEIEAACPGKQPKVRDLVARLDAGQPIGLSIGGWFRQVQYVWADGADRDWDDPERIIVGKVELEHLAVVRSPANPDSTGLQVLRSAGVGHRTRPVPSAVPEPDPVTVTPTTPENRSTPTPTEYVSPVTPTSTPAEPDERSTSMDTDKILAAINGLNATMEGLSARVQAVEQRTAAPAPAPAPATPAPTDDRVAKLEGEIARMKADRERQDNVIADLASGARALRVDDEFVIDDEEGRKASLRSAIARCREAKRTPAVATLAERHIDLLATNPGEVPGSMGAPSEAGDRARRNRAALPNLLRAICNAADRDGFFNYNASELRGWQA